MLTGLAATVGKAFVSASATEAVHAAAGHHDQKKPQPNLPNPNSPVPNPLTFELGRWRNIESFVIVSSRQGFVAAQQKARLAPSKPKPPTVPVTKAADAEAGSDDDKSFVEVSAASATAAAGATAAATGVNTAAADAKAPQGFWDRLKSLKRQGFSIILNELTEASRTAMEGMRTEMAAIKDKLASIDDPKQLKLAADVGEDLTYKVVKLTNKLACMFEDIQADLMNGGLNLNEVLALSQDRSERGIYDLMEEGIKTVNRLQNDVVGELTDFLPLLSKRIDVVCNPPQPQLLGTSRATLMPAPRATSNVPAMPASPASRVSQTADGGEVDSSDEQSFSPQPARKTI